MAGASPRYQHNLVSLPSTSVTFNSAGHIGNFCAEGVFGAGYPARLVVQEAQAVIHKAYQPAFLLDFLNPDVLAGKYAAQINLPSL